MTAAATKSQASAGKITEALTKLTPEALGATWKLCHMSETARKLPDQEIAATVLGWGKDIHFLLNNCPLSYLATASPSGAPELSLMFFNFDTTNNTILFNTPRGRKLDNILANKQVSMLLHNFEGKAATQSLFAGVNAQSFTLYGSASVMSGIAKNPSDGDYDKAFKGSNKAKVQFVVDQVLVVNQRGHSLRFNRRVC